MAYSALIDPTTGKILLPIIPDTGLVDQWSTEPAVSAVNFAGFNANNIGTATATTVSAPTFTGAGAVAVSAPAGALSLAGAGAGVAVNATAGNVAVTSVAGQVNLTSATTMTLESTGNGEFRSLGASTLQLQGGDVTLDLATAGVVLTANVGATPLTIDSGGAMTLDSNLANITLQTTGAGASGRISLVPATGAVIIAGGATVPDAVAGQLVISGGATLATGTGGGATSYTMNNGANEPITLYLPIKIGNTPYWIPLIDVPPT